MTEQFPEKHDALVARADPLNAIINDPRRSAAERGDARAELDEINEEAQALNLIDQRHVHGRATFGAPVVLRAMADALERGNGDR